MAKGRSYGAFQPAQLPDEGACNGGHMTGRSAPKRNVHGSVQCRNGKKANNYSQSAQKRAYEIFLVTRKAEASWQLHNATQQLIQAKENTITLWSAYRDAGAAPQYPLPLQPAPPPATSGSSCASGASATGPSSSSSSSSSSSFSASAFRSPLRNVSLPSLEAEADSAVLRLQEAQAQLQAERRLAAGLAAQLPVIQALSTRPQPHTAHAAASSCPAGGQAHPAPHGHVARLQRVACDVGLGRCPPVCVPPLNPLRPRAPGAKLLKCSHYWPRGATEWQIQPGTPSVWLLGAGGAQYIIKVEPCHSEQAQRERAAAGRSRDTGSGILSRLRPVEDAVQEAANAARINDQCATAAGPEADPVSVEPVLAPVAVFVRDSSLRGTSLCAGHDQEVVIVYPYCEAGDAFQRLQEVVDRTVRASQPGAAGVAGAAKSVVRELSRMAADLVQAVEAVHEQGWVLADLKPENTVWCPERRRLFLIDVEGASSLRGSPDGWLSGASMHTPVYAAPEQLDEDAPRRGLPSDVYAAGMSVGALLRAALHRFTLAAGQVWVEDVSQAGPGTQSPWSDVAEAEEFADGELVRAVEAAGLGALVEACTREQPHSRPTMRGLSWGFMP